MAFVDVNPRYRALLARQGLVAPADFFDWQGVFVGGHADRSIARVALGEGAERFSAYLKREQHIRWRHRLHSAWAGFGFVSRCYREALVLQQLQRADIGCPEMIAAGEDDHGNSFLLVRELGHATELRQFLRVECPSGRARQEVAVLLGRVLAKLHAAGFQHSDLYSKHILARKDASDGALSFAFLDWQRARRHRRVSWSGCWRDLAALDATLADDLATPRQRLACLAAYCHLRKKLAGARMPRLGRIARTIRNSARRLLRRRRIAEMRQPPLAVEGQSLMHADRKSVCLTRQFHEELRGELPTWLRLGTTHGPHKTQVELPVDAARQAVLVRQRVSRPIRWLWSWLRGKPLVSPEVEQAGTLFRLERYGIRAPRLLAFGQRCSRPWQVDSLLLTEVPAAAISLEKWLRRGSRSRLDRGRRRRLLRDAGDVLRRLHSAACYVQPADRMAEVFLVQTLPGRPEQIGLGTVRGLQRRHRPSARLALQDLRTHLATFDPHCSRTDVLRFLLAYLGLRRLNPTARRLASRILHSRLNGWGLRTVQRRTGA